MEKAKVEEYAELKADLADHGGLILPVAWLFTVVVFLTMYIIKWDLKLINWFLVVMGGLSLGALIFKLQERKKQKARLKVLQAELDGEK